MTDKKPSRFGAPPQPTDIRDNLSPEQAVEEPQVEATEPAAPVARTPARPRKDMGDVVPVNMEGMLMPAPVEGLPTDRPVAVEGRGRRKVKLVIEGLENLDFPSVELEGATLIGGAKSDLKNVSLKIPYNIYRDVKRSCDAYGLTLAQYFTYAHSKARHEEGK